MGLYENPPYYLTAYGIAVKRGFVGTELEWLESLVGKSVELRYDQETNALQWRNIGDTDWHDLMELEALQSEVITATLEELNQAKAETQTARDAALSAQSSAAAAAATATDRASAAETARTQAQTAQQKAEAAQKKAETAAASVSSVAAEVSKATQAATTATSKAQQASQSAASAAEQAAAAAEARSAAETAQQKAQAAAETVSGAKDAAQRAETAAQNAQTKAEEARSSAADAARDAHAATDAKTAAQTAGETAADKAVLAKSWAVGGTGTREDEDVNNAKYWSENAQNAAGGGVTSFCGRSGAVIPQKGDYTAQLVGARPDTWTPTALETGADPAGTAAAAVQTHQQAEDAHAALFEAKADRTLSNLTAPQTALYNLGAGVQPNLFDNAYFAGGGSQLGWGVFPINQLGLTTYTGNTRAHDRWKTVSDGTVSLEANGITLTQSGSAVWVITQVLNPSLVSRLTGKEVTISALDTQNNLYKLHVSSAFTGEPSLIDKVSIWCSSSGQVLFGTNAPTVKLWCAKFELGNKQTLAHLDSDGKWQRIPQPEDNNYAGTLSVCKQYFREMSLLRSSPFNITSSYLGFFVPIDPPMRIRPTIELDSSKILILNMDGSQIDGFTYTLGFVEPYGFRINANKENHGITNAASVIMSANAGFAIASAEL